ncbi:hypothetical protein CDN98_05770 [Roseateles terrae]|nr:hypothetical protein CDN98_05770 [Roseateles terrae]
MDADDEPTRASSRAGEGPARGTPAGAGSATAAAGASATAAAAAMPMTRLERMAEIDRRLEGMQAWPKTPALRSFLQQGRSLLCDAHRDGLRMAAQQARYQAWQRDVDVLDETWQAMPTVRDRWVDRLEAAMRRQPTPPRQGMLNEQLIPARQQVDLALEAFGRGQLDRALDAEAKAAERVQTAGRLITWMERSTESEIGTFSRQCQNDRLVNSTAQMRAFLDRMRRPDDEARLRQHLGSTGRESLLSAGSRTSRTSNSAPIETMLSHSLVHSLKELRAQADALPQNNLQRDAAKALCDALKTEVRAGPRQVKPEHRELYESLRQRITFFNYVAQRMRLSELAMSEIRDAMPQLPPAQFYRQHEAERLLKEIQSAFDREDHAALFQLGEHGDSLRRATVALARNRSADQHMLTHIAERRCELALRLKPWNDLGGLTSPALLYASQAKTLLRLLDESTDMEHCKRLLYEVEIACDRLAAMPGSRGGPRTPQAVHAAQALQAAAAAPAARATPRSGQAHSHPSPASIRSSEGGMNTPHNTSQGSSGSSSGRSVRSLEMLQALESMEALNPEEGFPAEAS